MASKSLFSSTRGALAPVASASNHAGGKAYSLSAKHTLAQLAATGCLQQTYYVSGKEQLTKVVEAAHKVEPRFIAQVAIYTRERGLMKDMPALLLAILSGTDSTLFRKAFPRVVTDGRMLRTFVQIMRSGQTGRKSLGSAPKQLVSAWITNQDPESLFRATVGNDPSLADVIKMVHPAPRTVEQEALFQYIIGKHGKEMHLPQLVRDFELYKVQREGAPPAVPFQMLTALELDAAAWTQIAKTMSWTQLRMELNTLKRHGVFDQEGMTDLIAAKIDDPVQVRRAKVFPYQIMTAWNAVKGNIPERVTSALESAVEEATHNVPEYTEKRIRVLVDVSGSMSGPVTGKRKGATTSVRCIDVATLIGVTLARRNPGTLVIPFDTSAHMNFHIDPGAGIFDNATKLAGYLGGGTACAEPLRVLNSRRDSGDLIVMVSDAESWADTWGAYRGGTTLMQEWEAYRARNTGAKMVSIDLTPSDTSQTTNRPANLLVGGFSDQVWDVIKAFVDGDTSGEHWTAEIEKVDI